MPYPYKKMTQEDFDKIIEITDNERVWVGDEIAKEYYKDEMPEYGVFPPELYVEVLKKEKHSDISSRKKSNQKIIDSYDYLSNAASAQDCTGLIPVGPTNRAELESYEEVYHYRPPKIDPEKCE